MATYQNMSERQDSKGGRIRWPVYTPQEQAILEAKFLGDWQNLEFLENFWNPVYDHRDILQYRRTAGVWRLRLSGKTFKSISAELGVDQRKACALVSGKNMHPYFVQMYLNSETLSRPREGWKWVLDCTPKPTNMYPKPITVPDKIQTYQDILDFLKQFPPVPSYHPAIKFFRLSSKWVEQHKAELFGFLLGFLVGDAGKDYPEYEYRSRHYNKTAMRTIMSHTSSNFRVLKYVQLALEAIGITSAKAESSTEVIRWDSTTSNTLTWILRVCLGLKPGERTSRNSLRMQWLLGCPREFLIGFIQGLADSDGSVNKSGYYAEIGSIPNASFYQQIFARIGTASRIHPKKKPIQLRIKLEPATLLPMFNPIIRSYRYQKLIHHAVRRKIIPPLPSFF